MITRVFDDNCMPAGPLVLQCFELREGILSDYPSYTDVVLIRNLVVAPITEEIGMVLSLDNLNF